MKKMVVAFLICVICPGVITYCNGQNVSREQEVKIEKQVDSLFNAMIKAAEDIDYYKLNKGVDDRYKAGFIANNTYFEQFDSLINKTIRNSQGIVKQNITIKKQKITVLTENIVLLTAFGDLRAEVSGGNEFDLKFYWSFVYEKINTGWKVIQSHQSTLR